MTVLYGRDWLDTDAWIDRDGRVYRGRGPYERRLVRWAKRKVAHRRRRAATVDTANLGGAT